MQGESYPQDWLVVDTKNVSDAIEHVEFWCDPARPSPRMPAPGRRQRWELMLRPGETSEEMQRESVARELLRPWLGSQNVEIERVAVYRFQARIADRFSSGRVFLAGDAAHLTPPFAGQGLVSGLRDVGNLAWKLAWVLRGHATTGILASYDVERRPHAKSTIDLARFMGRMIMPSNMPTAFLVHGAMRVVDALPYTRRLFRDLEIKPKNAFARGLFTRSRGPLRAGASFPQSRVKRGENEVWSDDLLGDHISFVGLGTALQVPTDLRERWRARGGQMLELELPSPRGVGAAVVRPDRVVMLQGRPSPATPLVEDALTLLTR